MVSISAFIGYTDGITKSLTTWEAAEVPREGEVLKHWGNRYRVMEIEWEPPTAKGGNSKVRLVVFPIPPPIPKK